MVCIRTATLCPSSYPRGPVCMFTTLTLPRCIKIHHFKAALESKEAAVRALQQHLEIAQRESPQQYECREALMRALNKVYLFSLRSVPRLFACLECSLSLSPSLPLSLTRAHRCSNWRKVDERSSKSTRAQSTEALYLCLPIRVFMLTGILTWFS
jgi:hypothetical protein